MSLRLLNRRSTAIIATAVAVVLLAVCLAMAAPATAATRWKLAQSRNQTLTMEWTTVREDCGLRLKWRASQSRVRDLRARERAGNGKKVSHQRDRVKSDAKMMRGSIPCIRPKRGDRAVASVEALNARGKRVDLAVVTLGRF